MIKFKRTILLTLLSIGLVVANAAEAVIGKQGPAGPAGKQGATGKQGPAGPIGPAGATGPAGPIGPASTVAGPTGPIGPESTVAGPQGTIGLTGPIGPIGPASTVAGPTGPEGPESTVAGPAGATGPAGPAGTTIANGTHTGDTLVWNGNAWTSVTKPSTGFVLLDANGVVIGDYDFGGSYAILLINSIYYQLPVTHEGFTEQQNIFASTPQSSTYFTTADCTGTAYYAAIDYSSPWTSQPFSNRVTLPIVYGNALYKQDPTQVSNILTMSRMVVGYNNNNCMRSGVPDIHGGTWGNGSGVPMNAVTPNSMILIEDLSIYKKPFSIQAN